MSNINLIVDSNIITNGLVKNSLRSGVYMVAFNILKELFKFDDINLYLHCNENKLALLNYSLKQEFPNCKYTVISNTMQKRRWKFFDDLFLKRAFAKSSKKKFLKTYYSLLILIFSPLNSLITSKYKLDFNVFNSNNFAYLSLQDEISKNFNKCKRYTFVHDVIPLLFPEHFPTSNKNKFAKFFKSINPKDYYIANSENTRLDFIKHCPQINPQHIITALLACDEKFKPQNEETIQNARKKYNIPANKKYIFSLCTLEPRKNLVRTVKTFIEFIKKDNLNDLVFVLGGGQWNRFIDQLETKITNLDKYKDKIIKAGYIDDEDLPALYSGAEWFVYTSQYEGFGLPPLEAMSCGCPVITSNNSSLPEVVGDAQIMVEWDSDEQHIKAYENYYYNENLRKENSKKGLERAQEFSWEKCTKQIIDVIRKDFI